MQITPDIENEIRVVHLVNLQGTYADESYNITIDDLRDVMRALWTEIPERFELLPDAHCKVIDHANTVRTYYVNEEMCKQLQHVFGFLEKGAPEHLFSMGFRPYDLLAVLGQLGVALEAKADRAQRMEQKRKTEEWARKFKQEDLQLREMPHN